MLYVLFLCFHAVLAHMQCLSLTRPPSSGVAMANVSYRGLCVRADWLTSACIYYREPLVSPECADLVDLWAVQALK